MTSNLDRVSYRRLSEDGTTVNQFNGTYSTQYSLPVHLYQWMIQLELSFPSFDDEHLGVSVLPKMLNRPQPVWGPKSAKPLHSVHLCH